MEETSLRPGAVYLDPNYETLTVYEYILLKNEEMAQELLQVVENDIHQFRLRAENLKSKLKATINTDQVRKH